jgi:tetratricopeptide (TPR) repeat protein
MKLSGLLLVLLISICSYGQTNKSTPAPSTVDVNQLLKMSPEEREAYKQKLISQASQLAPAAFPEMELKPPVKDLKRLSLIPSRPPNRQEITNSLQQSIQQIKKGIPAPKIEAINQQVESLTVEQIDDKAIASFYQDKPEEGLLLLMELTKKDPDEINSLNNLSSMLTMCGVEQKAIPLLMYALEKVPNSSTLLNNIGQAYMGLGDMQIAMNYFNQCLAIDELNPEANHSMGMIHYYKKEYDNAMQYFEKELSVSLRRSTLAMAYKMGKKFNVGAIARNRNRYKGAGEKDYFEEITLGKFSLPAFPSTTKELAARKNELQTYAASIQAEMLFWMNNAQQVNLAASQDADAYPGLYFDLVEAMLEDLGKEFTPEYLIPYGESETALVTEIISSNSQAITRVKCPEAPAGSSIKVQQEFAIACCENQKRPLADKLMGELGSEVKPIFDLGVQRWKSYINQLVAIVQLDPSPANQAMVYNAVSGYFSFLNLAMLMYTGGEITNLLVDCVPDYKPTDLDSLVQADREWKMGCPSWLNIEVDLGGASIKADCNKYAIEAGAAVMGGFEHEFKTGKSTLLVGVGIKDKIARILKIEAKSQFYISFDNNKEFSDFGIRNTYKLGLNINPLPIGGIKVGANYGGIESVNNKSLLTGSDDYKVSRKGVVAALFD